MTVSTGWALTRPARCRHGPRSCPSRLPGFGSMATVMSFTAGRAREPPWSGSLACAGHHSPAYAHLAIVAAAVAWLVEAQE